MANRFGKLMLAVLMMFGFTQHAIAADIEEIDVKGKPTIVIMGDIDEGDEEKFRKLAVKHGKATVVLASDGGLIRTALDIGRIIRMMGYSTMVISDTTCSSSCALIWLAGTPRYAEKSARVGFHAGYRVDGKKAVEDGMANAMIGRYLTQLNLDDAGVMAATAASPDKMLWLDTSEPGAEGISYETYVSVTTEAKAKAKASAPPPLVRIPAKTRTPAPTSGRAYGAWTYTMMEGNVFSITAIDTLRTSFLGYVCGPDVPCSYLLKMPKICDAGDSYTLDYRVDDGEKTSFELECSKTGKSLRVSDTAAFNGDISGGKRLLIYGEGTNNEVFTLRFSLIGRDSAITALEDSEMLQRIEK